MPKLSGWRHFEVYKDTSGEWRWRLVATNGNIVADGAEGYASKRNAKRAVGRFQSKFAGKLPIIEG